MAIHERPGGPDAARAAAGSPQRATPRPASAAAALLRLQARAGNRATRALVARQRGPGSAPAPAERPGARRHRMTVAGVGSFELLSFTLREPASVAVVFDAGRDGARFMRAAAEGRSFESVTIRVGARTITLEDVVVTSIHVPERHGDDGFVLSLELSGSSRVFT